MDVLKNLASTEVSTKKKKKAEGEGADVSKNERKMDRRGGTGARPSPCSDHEPRAWLKPPSTTSPAYRHFLISELGRVGQKYL